MRSPISTRSRAESGIVQGVAASRKRLMASKRTSEAWYAAKKRLRSNRTRPGAHPAGTCLAALGDIEGAIAEFDTALATKPDCAEAINSKIFVLDFSDEADFEQHRNVRRLWWKHIGSKIPRSDQPYRNTLDPRRRIVVGYLSSDFRDHSAAKVFKPACNTPTRPRFETVCYSCSPARDRATWEFQQMADRWHNASQWSDDRLADQIRQDGIDIWSTCRTYRGRPLTRHRNEAGADRGTWLGPLHAPPDCDGRLRVLPIR